MLKRILQLLKPTLPVVAILMASLVAASASARADGGTLVYGMPADHDIMDPHATGGWITYHVTYQMFESFVKEDLTEADVMTPKLVPGPGDPSWEVSDDGTAIHLPSARRGQVSTTASPSTPMPRMFNFARFWDKDSPSTTTTSPRPSSAAYTQWIKSRRKDSTT